MHIKNKSGLYLIAFLTAVIISGCGVWDNFTTYFNRYYNTVQLFDQAEQSIQNTRTDIFAVNEPPISYADKQKLDNVIEKCSKILQFSPDSKYVDDALLMLGKTFYYQQNFLKSSREFEELLSTQNDSDLRLEASLWLAKCQIKLNKQEEGLKNLKSVKEQAEKDEENDILQLALIEEIKYYLSQDQLDNAIKSSEDFIALTDENDRSEKVEYELGQLYEQKKDYENATKTYQRLVDSSPSFDMELIANLALGRAYRNNGQVEKSLELFDNMSSEDKNKSSLDQIELEKGISLYKLGRNQDAVDVLTTVDTTYKTSVYAGAAKFQLGKIFENVYDDFDSAYYYYSRAVLTQLPLDYVEEAQSKSAEFNKYKNIRNELNFNIEQLNYATNPDDFAKDSTEYYSRKKEIEEKITALQNQQTEGRNRTNLNPSDLPQNQLVQLGKPPVKPIVSADSIKNKIALNKFDLANMFFTEMDRLDSAYYYYKDIIENYPESGLIPNTLFALGNYYLSMGDSVKADSLFNVVYENYKDNTIVNSAANILNKPTIDFNYDPAKKYYVDAEDDLKNNNYYSSLEKLHNIYKDYPTSLSAPKALYATGWILENKLLKLDSAAVVYDSLISKYPRSEYAKDISQKIATYHKEMEMRKKQIEDSLKAIAVKKLEQEKTDSLKTVNKNLVPEQKKTIDDKKDIPPMLKEKINDKGLNPENDNIDSLRIKKGDLPPKEILLKKEEAKKDTTNGLIKRP